MTVRARAHRTGAAVLLAALVLTACGAGDGPEASDGGQRATGEDLQVVATTSILGDVVAALLGDDGTVEVLMPAGSDPHGYEPSARDAALLRDAELVVANGLGLEESLRSALEAAEEDGVRVVEVAGHLDPIEFGADDPHGHDEDDEHAAGALDPHVWHDPLRMADAVHLIAAELADASELVDDHEWQARAEAYEERLLAVHEEVRRLLSTIPDEHRKLVTNHDSFGYLAARYDIEVLGTVIPGSSTEAETSPGDFADLIETLEETRVPAIFSENVDSDRLSEQLAGEVLDRSDLEVEVVELFSDALGGPGSGAETYPGMLTTNAERLADALG